MRLGVACFAVLMLASGAAFAQDASQIDETPPIPRPGEEPVIAQAEIEVEETPAVVAEPEPEPAPVAVTPAAPPKDTNVIVVEKEPPPGPKATWFYADVQAGMDYIGLTTFNADLDDLTAELLPSRAWGPSLDAGLGFRIVFLTLGARLHAGWFNAQDSALGSWSVWRIGPEIGMRVPLGSVEPWVSLGGGYATIGGADDLFTGVGRGLDINGYYGALSLGVDFFVTKWLSVGVAGHGELLAMSRNGVSIRELFDANGITSVDEAKQRVLEADGSSLGSSAGMTLGAGLHF